MKKIITGILAGILLMQAVSAYHYSNYRYNSPRSSYNYNPYYDTGRFCFSFDDYGCSYGYPEHRYRYAGGWNFDREQNDWKWEREKWRAANWIDDTFQARYELASGRASGEVFGGVDEPARSSTNFRYREAYDPGFTD